jgi:DNA polymerase I-like protein with 3'-5' exonuclease and polymerase domains
VDYLNRGMLRTDGFLQDGQEILAQTHDGFLMECAPEHVTWIKDVIQRAVEKSMSINERELTIPVKLKVGENWRDVE